MFKPAKCPSCAGDITLSAESGTLKCSYCGTEIVTNLPSLAPTKETKQGRKKPQVKASPIVGMLVCPHCYKEAEFTCEPETSGYNLNCGTCSKDFTVLFVKVRSRNSRLRPGGFERFFSVRVIDFAGEEGLIEFTKPGRDNFELKARDIAVFSYINSDLKLVQNLTIKSWIDLSPPTQPVLKSNGCRVILIIAFAFLAAILALVILLQDHKNNDESPPKAYTFDVTTANVPINYSGDDWHKLYDELWAATHPKGTYEKTEEYNARIETAMERYSTRDLVVEGAMRYEYDADKEELTGHLPYVHPFDKEAKTLLRPFDWDSYGLIIPGRLKEVKFKLRPVDPSRAREIMNSSLVLFICKLKPFKSSDSTEPKLIEGDSSYGNVYVQLNAVWLYSKRSGEVFEKLKFADIAR